MTIKRRAVNITISLFMILAAFILILFPSEGIDTILGILSISLFIYSIQTLLYYVQMARHMVNGRMILWKGLILLEISIYIFSLNRVPEIYVTIYLFITLLLSGVVEIMRSFEGRRMAGFFSKTKLSGGLINLIAGIICLIFVKNPDISVYVYSASLVVSAFYRIFRTYY